MKRIICPAGKVCKCYNEHHQVEVELKESKKKCKALEKENKDLKKRLDDSDVKLLNALLRIDALEADIEPEEPA